MAFGICDTVLNKLTLRGMKLVKVQCERPNKERDKSHYLACSSFCRTQIEGRIGRKESGE